MPAEVRVVRNCVCTFCLKSHEQGVQMLNGASEPVICGDCVGISALTLMTDALTQAMAMLSEPNGKLN